MAQAAPLPRITSTSERACKRHSFALTGSCAGARAGPTTASRSPPSGHLEQQVPACQAAGVGLPPRFVFGCKARSAFASSAMPWRRLPPAARGGAPHADGRSFLWLARFDRLVSRSRLGLAAALLAGLRAFDTGGETILADCFARGEHRLEDVALTGTRARTHVAMVHADGQAEPWIIAMSDRPTPGRARDCGLRWGIEAMFSDFKTRGFNLEAARSSARSARPAHPGVGHGGLASLIAPHSPAPKRTRQRTIAARHRPDTPARLEPTEAAQSRARSSLGTCPDRPRTASCSATHRPRMASRPSISSHPGWRGGQPANLVRSQRTDDC